MNEISARLLSHSLLAWSLNGLSGCDGWCLGECASPGNADEGNGTSNPSGPGDSGDGADDTGGEGGMIPDLCSYPALAGLSNCESWPYLAMPLRGTDTVPPNSTHTVEYVGGFWERSTYGYDEWARLQGHLSFRGGLDIPTQGHTHFSIMVATDECSEGWWSMTTDIDGVTEIPVLGSEVLVVDGKDVLKVDHLVPDPTAPTTFVQVVWFVELCDPYVFIIDGQLGGAITRSDPGGTIEDSDPGGFFKVIIGMGAVTYDGAS